MTLIKPFKALHYNPAKVGDLSRVMCPPYDVISTQEQSDYHNASPHNFIWIDLGKERAGDNKTDNNKYTRATKLFQDWLEKHILIEDEKPAIYFYKQEYNVRGQKQSRMGFISLMRLQDEKDSKVFPHENTHAHAVEDRFTLWSALKADLSCIFVCFSDKTKRVEKIFQKISMGKPFVDVLDNDKIRHILWRLDDPALIAEITGSLKDQSLFIADGHHRYKVANEIRKAKMANRRKLTGEEPFNYVMTYFTNMDSPDLQILPIHRIIKKLGGSLDFLEELFRIDKIKTKEDLAIMLARAGQNEHAFGLYTADGIRLLRLKNKSLIEQNIPEGSKDFKSLDATILKYFVLNRLGIRSEDIIYSKDINEATAMVEQGQAEASFILNPVKIQQLKAIALRGERMPPKTTYFYPKVLSGLTVYRFDS